MMDAEDLLAILQTRVVNRQVFDLERDVYDLLDSEKFDARIQLNSISDLIEFAKSHSDIQYAIESLDFKSITSFDLKSIADSLNEFYYKNYLLKNHN